MKRRLLLLIALGAAALPGATVKDGMEVGPAATRATLEACESYGPAGVADRRRVAVKEPAPSEAQLARSTGAPAAGGIEETGGVGRGRLLPGQPLETRQRRLFVLGIGASGEK